MSVTMRGGKDWCYAAGLSDMEVFGELDQTSFNGEVGENA